jgi:hypothetical protein
MPFSSTQGLSFSYLPTKQVVSRWVVKAGFSLCINYKPSTYLFFLPI